MNAKRNEVVVAVKLYPPSTPHGARDNVHVPAPAGEFKLVAQDNSPTQWFAFKAPRVSGRLSLWTLCLLSAWQYFLILGLGGFLLNLVRWRHKV